MLLRIKHLGRVEYTAALSAMRDFCAMRQTDTADELWFVEHPPVYTLGQAGRREHLLRNNGIPLLPSDRGGQITYHGPGQIVVYMLLDLHRRRLGVRDMIRRIEQAIIALLANYGIESYGDVRAPGVYVAGAKIAALGLRVRRGCSYHGASLNVHMDLSPFADINPCGFPHLPVTQMSDLGVREDLQQIQKKLAQQLKKQFSDS